MLEIPSCTVNEVSIIEPETLVQHFQNTYTVMKSVDECNIHNTRGTCVTDYGLLNSEITQSKISNAIISLKKKKSAGSDGILMKMLKCSKSMLMSYLIKLFDTIFDQKLFPKLWTHSLIVPIHKKGAWNDPNNFRSISLTSIFNKTFLHVLYERLKTWADKNNIIGEDQAGCRKGCSTVDNIFVLHNRVQEAVSAVY